MRVGRASALFIALVASVAAGACLDADGLHRFEYSEPHMGTQVRIVLHAESRVRAEAIAQDAFATVSRLDSLFSDYRTDSEIAQLARESGSGSLRPVTDELWEVLNLAEEWSEWTDGAFDITVGPLTLLWRWAMRRGVFPDSARHAEARARSGHEGLRLDSLGRAASLVRDGMSLDLGGIAKGYIAQAVADQIARDGARSVLVDAGGDIVLGDPPPGEEGWRIEFPGREAYLLSNAAVATSGDQYQFLEHDGVRYSHILDPRTGLGVPDAPTVVVVAGDGTTADVLASALTVLGAEAGRALVASLEDVAARVIPPGGEAGGWETDDFPRLRRRP